MNQISQARISNETTKVTMTDPLSSSNVLRILKSVAKHQSQVHDTIKSPIQALALFTHSCMLALDFRLVGLSEDDSLGILIPVLHSFVFK